MLDILIEYGFQLLQLVLEALLPVLAVMAIKWVQVLIKNGIAKLEPNVQDILNEGVRIAVLAAEQMGLSQQLQEKKAFALEMAQLYLAEHGVELDIEVIAAAIEAAVMDEFNRGKVG